MSQTPLHPRLLYIEVNDDARALVRQLLNGRYLVLEASDPLAAFDSLHSTQPDLVLLDVHLPNLTGFEVAIRLHALLPGVPVVAVTAEDAPGMVERALALGFAGVISKPLNEKTFGSQVDEFLLGKREPLDDPQPHLRAYMLELVEHLDIKSRELTGALNRNRHLQMQNQEIISILIRRQGMLEAGTRVSHGITSILNLSDLLHSAVDIICSEFELYYSGIFLVSDNRQTLALHAGRGEAGRAMQAANFFLPVDRHSMIGSAVLNKKAGIALDVEGEPSRFKNPYLPKTRSEMALPLMFKDLVFGALTVQSEELNAFTEEDTIALQSLADQIAIAIHNAQLIRRLDSANQELVRSKTFEAIATATGEAIHWVGNKAAPVAGSVRRVREDFLNVLAIFQHIITDKHLPTNPLLDVAGAIFAEAESAGVDLPALAQDLLSMPVRQRKALVSLESMLEDLQIIENSAATILNIKEDLIGPARQRNPSAFSLIDEIERIVSNMALPKGVVTTRWPDDLPLAYGDPRQIDQVFNNLIKNAWEAMDETPDPHIDVSLQCEEQFLVTCVRDNGPGISSEVLEKIWVSFFTTKAGKGGTGLGLPACMEIARQNGGKIWVESEPGKGAAFYVQLPVAP